MHNFAVENILLLINGLGGEAIREFSAYWIYFSVLTLSHWNILRWCAICEFLESADDDRTGRSRGVIVRSS